MVKFKKRIKMKDKNHHHHAIWQKGLTSPLAKHTPKMFKIFRSCKVLSINGIEHNFTPRKREMLCKFCANRCKEKVKHLIIKHLTFRFVGVTGFEPATPWSQTRCATGLRYTPNAWLLENAVQRYVVFPSLANFGVIIL